MHQAAPKFCCALTTRPQSTACRRSTLPTTLKSHTSGNANPPRDQRHDGQHVGGEVGEYGWQGFSHHAGHEKYQAPMPERVQNNQGRQRLFDGLSRELGRHVPLGDQSVDDPAQQKLQAEDGGLVHCRRPRSAALARQRQAITDRHHGDADSFILADLLV